MNADRIHHTAMAYALDPTPENMEEAVNAETLPALGALNRTGRLPRVALPVPPEVPRASRRSVPS